VRHKNDDVIRKEFKVYLVNVNLFHILLMFLLISVSATLQDVYRCPSHLLNKGNNLDTYGGYCFHYVHEFVSWDSAKSKCEANSGHLVVITNLDMNTFLVNMLQGYENTPNYVWIGAHDKHTEGTWYWVNGELLYSII